MDGWDGLCLVAMLMLLAILAVLLMQYLQLGKMGQTIEQWHATTQERQRRIGQQAELHSALRCGFHDTWTLSPRSFGHSFHAYLDT